MWRALANAPLALALCACASRPPERPPQRPEAYAGSARYDLSRLDAAVRRFAADRAGRLPASLDDLAREGPPEGGTYLRGVPWDPWGQPYAYAVTSEGLGTYDLRSYGPDRSPATPDDVVTTIRAVPRD